MPTDYYSLSFASYLIAVFTFNIKAIIEVVLIEYWLIECRSVLRLGPLAAAIMLIGQTSTGFAKWPSMRLQVRDVCSLQKPRVDLDVAHTGEIFDTSKA